MTIESQGRAEGLKKEEKRKRLGRSLVSEPFVYETSCPCNLTTTWLPLWLN